MLVNYTTIVSPTDIQEVLDTVRTFALSQGWTQSYWIQDKLWDRIVVNPDPLTYDYGYLLTSTDGNFLQLTSPGYGGQTVIAAIQHRNDHVQIAMRTQTAYSEGDVSDWDTPPTYQNRVHADQDLSSIDQVLYQTNPDSVDTQWGCALKSGSMQKAWVFGNSRYIACVVDIDGVYFTMFHFGVMNLFDTSPSGYNGVFSGWQAISNLETSDYITTWQRHDITTYASRGIASGLACGTSRFSTTTNTLYGKTHNIWYDNREITQGSGFTDANLYAGHLLSDGSLPNTDERHMRPNNGKLVHGASFTNGIVPHAFKANGFSGRSPMYKQVYFYQRQSDDVWCPFAESYAYLMRWQGLVGGQTYSYGGRQYIAFPIKDFNANIGYAFRIA